MKNRALRIPFGVLDGRLVEPGSVARGRECGCACPECEWPLIANQGEQTRPYFSHDNGTECAGGFETAVHKMAKQILLEHKCVVLPEHTVNIKVPITGDDDVLEGAVQYPEREVHLVSVVSEKMAQGTGRWIPDVTATLKNGARLYIEIKVTHGVGRGKAEALDNLMEITLGDWALDALADPEILERAVLRMAKREWFRCSLYSDLRKVHLKRAELEGKVADVHERRRKRAIKEHRAVLDREEERLALRAPYLVDIQRLIDVGSAEGQKSREQLLAEQARDEIANIPKLFPREFKNGRWPAFLTVRLVGDWLFNTDRRVWQAYIYERAIADVPVGHKVSLRSMTQLVCRRFGVVDWAKRLFDLKMDTVFETRNRKSPVSETDVWFLSSEENALIRTPSSVVRSYLDALVAFGLLQPDGKHDYQVTTR